jgi:hypothetical protein
MLEALLGLRNTFDNNPRFLNLFNAQLHFGEISSLVPCTGISFSCNVFFSLLVPLFSLYSSLSVRDQVSHPVVLYECETWSLTLREERRLRVFENRVLRRIFGLKRDEVKGEWRKLHNE